MATAKKATTKKEMPDRYVAEAAGVVVDGRYGRDGKLHPVQTKRPGTQAKKK